MKTDVGLGVAGTIAHFLFCLSWLFFFACADVSSGPDLAQVDESAESNNNNQPSSEPDDNEDRIFITDQTGKQWDVTHARDRYGMLPWRFQFGLGPNAIEPLINPLMLPPTHQYYPDNSSNLLVMGTTIENHALAYGINLMSYFEVANDRVGDTSFAAAY